MRIIVAGTSTLKYEATKKAVYELMLKNVEVEMLKIPSTGVSEQPIGEEEILKGAMRRAELARENDSEYNKIPTLYLGIENGVEKNKLLILGSITLLSLVYFLREKN
jgi:non-canonical (house-cleaning) NTP pyrophosphatase